jgi:hypothetical protein
MLIPILDRKLPGYRFCGINSISIYCSDFSCRGQIFILATPLLTKKFEYAKHLETPLLSFYLCRRTLCGFLLLWQQICEVLAMTKESVDVTFFPSFFCLSLAENKDLNVI